MTLLRPIRSCLLTALLLPASAAALAQRQGGGPGGGGPGGPGGPGGAMGAPGSMSPGGNGRNMGNPRDRGPAPNGSSGSPLVRRDAPQLGPPGRWWDDKKIARNLSLRNDQQRKMDDLFEAGKGNLVQLYSNLQREEGRLSTMSSAELSDETKVFAAIDRVAQARADVAKANAHILLQLRKEMDASQLAALDREIASLR